MWYDTWWLYVCIFYRRESENVHGPMKKRFVCICVSVLLLLSLTAGTLAALWPDYGATGGRKSDGSLDVITANAKEGYLLVRGGKTKKRLKLRVKQGEHSIMYDLGNDNEYDVIPLQFGNGRYRLNLFRQVSGSRYSEEGVIGFTVEMPDVNAPFLYPNQYISYSPESKAVKKAEEICAGVEKNAEKYRIISDYVLHNFAYDYIRAVTTKGDGKPDVDYCMEKGMGICLDLASTSVCMLRSQGVPAKLVIGSANGQYHAWVQVTVDGEEKLFDPTAILQNMAQPVEYAVERWY